MKHLLTFILLLAGATSASDIRLGIVEDNAYPRLSDFFNVGLWYQVECARDTNTFWEPLPEFYVFRENALAIRDAHRQLQTNLYFRVVRSEVTRTIEP